MDKNTCFSHLEICEFINCLVWNKPTSKAIVKHSVFKKMVLAFNLETPWQRSGCLVSCSFVELLYISRECQCLYFCILFASCWKLSSNPLFKILLLKSASRGIYCLNRGVLILIYTNHCHINKCLADDFTCTNLPGDNEYHSPNVPKEPTCSAVGSTPAFNLCSFLRMRKIISFSMCLPKYFRYFNIWERTQ